MGSIYDSGVKPFQNQFYIHNHQKNIGRCISAYRDNEQGISSNDLANWFSVFKNSAKEAVLTQYKTLVGQHFINNVDAHTQFLLKQIFNDNDNLDKINSAMKNELQQRLQTTIAQNIIKKQQEIDWDNIVKAIDNLIKEKPKDKELSLGYIDELFQSLADAVQIVNTYGEGIAAILLNATHKRTLSDMGKQLFRALMAEEQRLYKSDGKTFKSLQAQQIAPVLQKLKTLGSVLARYKTSSDESNITGKYIKNYIEKQVFSTALGEAVAAGIVKAGTDTAVLSVKNSVKNISNVGSNTVTLDYSDPMGRYTGEKGYKRQGKSDIQFNNVFLDIDYILGTDIGKINVNFGISNKAYKTIGFEGSKGISEGYISGGSIKLQTALDMLTSSEQIQYLAYNTLAWTSKTAPKSGSSMKNKKDLTQPLIALQDALFTRSVIYLFGSRGQEDFANFIMVNGKLVSLWDIIKEVCNEKILYSASMDKSNSAPLHFSIEGHEKFGAYLGIRKRNSMYTRVIETNRLINSSSIHGSLDISKLNI